MIPREIKRLRGSVGMTQAQFGLMVHANPTTVSRWESGKTSPSAWHVSIMESIRVGACDQNACDRAYDCIVFNKPADALGWLLAAALRARN